MSLDPTQLSNLLGIASPVLQERVNTKITETLEVLEHKLDRTFTTPVVLYDLKGTTAGQAIVTVQDDITTLTIRLNLPALNNPEFREHIIDQTVPHEIAHLVEWQIYGTLGHGYRWQRLMQLLGLPADRTHDLPLPKARKQSHTLRYNHSCSCRNHIVSAILHNRIQQGRIYRCQYCNGRLLPE